MRITPEELKRSYGKMSNEELLAIDTDDLTDVARQCHAGELERRGLHLRTDREAPAVLSTEEGAWESAGTFRSLHEAQLAHGLLQSAGISAELESNSGDLLWMGSNAHKLSRVLVPEELLDDARGIIESHAVQEELAAQAGAEPLPVIVTARYEDGVFKPLEPVDWEEGTEVEVRLLTG
jgi:hypothetical protein